MKNVPIACVLLLFLSACLEEADCLRTSTTNLTVRFRTKLSGADTTINLSQIVLAGSDSVYYAPAETVEALNIVTVDVNPYSDTTTMIFSMESEADHLLQVVYDRITRFISPECGTETLISGLRVVESDFDSVRVTGPVLIESANINVEIFR